MVDISTYVRQSRLYPVLVLEHWVTHHTRRRLLMVGKILLFVIFYLAIVPYLFSVGIDGLFSTTALDWLLANLMGLFFVILALLIPVYLLDAYFRSYYFGNIISNNYDPGDLFTFTVGRILYGVRHDDLVSGFLVSETGQLILRRLGVFPAAVTVFLVERGEGRISNLPKPAGQVLKLRELVEHIFNSDQEFSDFLFKHEIRLSEFLAATDWVINDIESSAQTERWWSRENLERVPGIAKDWAYGGAYTLEKYGRDLLNLPESTPTAASISVYEAEVRQLETILARSSEANALLIAPPGQAKWEVLLELARQIRSGRVVPVLESKRLILLNVGVLLASFHEKSVFEQEVIKIFNEALRAGNVLLAIDDLAALILGAENMDAGLISLLDRYLTSDHLQIIALADTDKFNQHLSPRGELVRRFEVVQIREVNEMRLMTTMQSVAGRLEQHHPIFFTYPGVLEVAKSAEQYFQGEATADKGVDLLIEIVPWAIGHGKTLIGRAEVLEFVREKTSIPLGAIGGDEREKLLQLESRLHERVIGQELAIKSISGALRRSRTGVRNEKRPIGSFLFLGPTGVGKTETAKALATVIFGREETMMRLDMSEFQGADALNRLIGSFAENKAGILANLLRQTSYGVLLLDEFEKTHRDVLNLFLQILDEGFFSDMSGKRVNARNIIFIATSNAGADLVWKMVGKDIDPSTRRDELINHLVGSGAFRPELLNRFDDIIIFHPLSAVQLAAVAKLLLERLRQRLRERGIDFVINSPLVEQVVALGTNQLFGARPMLRFIQDNLEQKIADSLIRGDLSAGSKIEFNNNLEIIISR